MTEAQKRAVERIRRDVYESLYGDDYEVKEFKTEEINGYRNTIIYLTAETGMKNDEGKLTSVLCRERINVCIGPRGGISYTAYNRKNMPRKKYVSYFSTYLDQR